MRGRNFVRSTVRRISALTLSAAMLMTSLAVPVAAEGATEVVLEENKDYHDQAIQNPYVEQEDIRSSHIFTDALTEEDRAFIDEAVKSDDTVKLEVKVTVKSYEKSEGKTAVARLVAMEDYNAGDGKNKWRQNPKTLGDPGTYELSLDISDYVKFTETSQLSLEFGDCKESSYVDYTIDYAKVVRTESTGESGESGTITLDGAGSSGTTSVAENAYWGGESYNGKYISDIKFTIPHKLKFGLDGFTALKWKVEITIDQYTADPQAPDEEGAEPVVMIYAMDETYGNWNQVALPLTEQGQKLTLEMDLIEKGYTSLGEFGIRIGGCENKSEIKYTLNTAEIIAEGESHAGAGTIELQYPLTGETKDLAFEATPVGLHGKLSVASVEGLSAPTIVDKNGKPLQLRGASSHGLSWFPDYVNESAFHSLRDEFGMNLVRIAVYAREGGYTQGHAEVDDQLIQKGVQAAKDLGMYVIIDWHVLNYNPNEDIDAAKTFFEKYATMYKDYDNVLFEICNEPTGTSWYDGTDNDLYSYCKTVTNVIRGCGSDAIVICGTNQYSSEIQEVADKPLSEDGYTNIMYTCHFYSASHYDEPQKKLLDAIAKGVPAFVSEFGICTASGDGRYDTDNADKWLDICDQNNISYAVWALSNSQESAAFFVQSCTKTDGGWLADDLTNTGRYILNRYNRRLAELNEVTNPTPTQPDQKPGTSDTEQKPGTSDTEQKPGTTDTEQKPGTTDNQTGKATKVTLNTKKLYLVKGKSVKIKKVLKATMAPANTTDRVTWSSGKKAVVTIKGGKLVPKKKGKAVITAKTTSGKTAKVTVYVVNKPKNASSVKLNKKKISMKKGTTKYLKATLKPSNSTSMVTWKSSNKKVVAVDGFGELTAKAKGSATITVKTSNGKKTTCKISVK